jgi:O-acetyl-ADP-ribose deacetylase (regulator of RNase III)
MYGQRGEAEQLYKAYAAALALHNQALDTNSIAFVSMGTGADWLPYIIGIGAII